jgi:hypothetical protein
MQHIDSASSFLPIILCIGEVRLFFVDVMLVDKLPSLVSNAPAKGRQFFFIVKCIDNVLLLSLVDADMVNKTGLS